MATNKSVLSQLQSVGEDAVARITKSPTTRSALEKGMQLKDRAGKTLTGLEGVEQRLSAIEKRLSALEGKAKPKPATRIRSTTAKTAASKTTAAKPKPRASTTKPKSSSS
jgi:hypothetical protein